MEMISITRYQAFIKKQEGIDSIYFPRNSFPFFSLCLLVLPT